MIVGALFHDNRFPTNLQPKSPFFPDQFVKSLFENEEEDPNISLGGGSSVSINAANIFGPNQSPIQTPNQSTSSLHLHLSPSTTFGASFAASHNSGSDSDDDEIDDILRGLLQQGSAPRIDVPLPRFTNPSKSLAFDRKFCKDVSEIFFLSFRHTMLV